MMKRLLFAVVCITGLGLTAWGQDGTVVLKITGGQKPVIAIPDFRGAGDAAQFMNAFNQSLFSDIQDSGLFDPAGKTMSPLVTPQQPSDFQQPGPAGPTRRAPWLTDWSSPPVKAKYLA